MVRPTTAASEADLQLFHTVDHIERIKRDAHLYEIATLAVGGAISEIAVAGGVAFEIERLLFFKEFYANSYSLSNR